MHRAFLCPRHHLNPARGPANRSRRARRPTRHSTNPARHTFRSAARAFSPASRPNCSAPQSPRPATRASCSTRRAGELHAPSFFLGPPSNFPDRCSYFLRVPSAPARRAGKISRPSRLFSPRPECPRPPAGKISRHARSFGRALHLRAGISAWRIPIQSSIDPRWAFPRGPVGWQSTCLNPSGHGELRVPARWSIVFERGYPPSGW